MKHGTMSYTALAAGVALACGISSVGAQQGADVDDRIDASEEQAEQSEEQREAAEDVAEEQAEERQEAAEDAAEEQLEAAEERDEQRQEAAEERQDVAEEAGETEDLAARRAEVLQTADEALEQLRQQNEQAAALLDRAYGHAVFDTTKGGLIVTGAGGTGVARDNATGKPVFMHLGSAGVGLGAGLENYKLVLLFEDRETYDEFVAGQWDGSISAQAAAGREGAAAEEQFVEGVGAYRLTDAGLMAQVDVSGVRFWPSEKLNDEATLAALEEPGGEAGASSQQAPGNPERLDQLAQEHEDLDTFVEAVKAAGMEDSLTGDRPYTVFAPTNEAFASLGENLLAPESREELILLLRAHIVADDVDEETARSLGEAKTIDGGTVEISAEGERLMVGDARVVEPDIESGNLRVYAIDKVLSDGRTQVATGEGQPAEQDREEGRQNEQGEQGEEGDQDERTLR